MENFEVNPAIPESVEPIFLNLFEVKYLSKETIIRYLTDMVNHNNPTLPPIDIAHITELFEYQLENGIQRVVIEGDTIHLTFSCSLGLDLLALFPHDASMNLGTIQINIYARNAQVYETWTLNDCIAYPTNSETLDYSKIRIRETTLRIEPESITRSVLINGNMYQTLSTS